MKSTFTWGVLILSLIVLPGRSQNLSPCKDKPELFPYQIKHTPPVNQGKTNTCWAFSTVSFLESEIMRLSGKTYQLSAMWVVYHAYLEKARNYYEQQGKARLSGGGLAHDVVTIIQKYGIVQQHDYAGLKGAATMHDHTELDQAMRKILNSLIPIEDMTTDFAVLAVRQILDDYLGVPPDTIEVEGQSMTPQAFAQEILKLPLENYLQITSFQSFPFYTSGKLGLPDNWLQFDRYLNVPLNEFLALIRGAITNNFSVVIDMDLSEAGYRKEQSLATLNADHSTIDSIDQQIRERHFASQATTDDHLQHLIGFAPCPDEGGFNWYLIKDSLPSSYNSASKGYIYMREDYVRLKVLSFMVHKEAVRAQLEDNFPDFFVMKSDTSHH